jgi:hypothetical protein
MNYCSIDEDQKKHLLKLIDFLYYEVLSAGGDGDALWYSKYYPVKDILPLIEEYNSKLKFKWEIKGDDKNIYWGESQEGMIITNDEEVYKKSPSWQQCLIKY